MTDKQKDDLYKNIVSSADLLRAKIGDDVIKNCQICTMTDFSDRAIGARVDLGLSSYHYYDEGTFRYWQRMLKAGGWSIRIVQKQLHIIFTIMYKDLL